jgi:hypothetical protein
MARCYDKKNLNIRRKRNYSCGVEVSILDRQSGEILTKVCGKFMEKIKINAD